MCGSSFKILLSVILLAAAQVGLGASLKVKKKATKLYSEPSKGSSVVVVLNKDDILESSGRKGMYWQVTTAKGEAGFVSVMKVKQQAGSSSALAGVIQKAAKNSRASGNNSSIRSRSAVMGVRGLDASEQVAFAGNMKPDYRLVFRMEDRVVTQKNIEQLGNDIESEIEKKITP